MSLPTHRWRFLAFAAFIVLYFLFFTYRGLGVHFALDDLGNMAHYYRGGPMALAVSQFTLWRGDYRPLGGLFYVPIFHFAGLNPVPYQAALLLILLANAWLLWRLARLLGCSELQAGLATTIGCYHAGLHNLYYNAAFVYDALCCFFYLAALIYYAHTRQSGRPLNWRRIAILLLLTLCSLNSKEMAVTLPLMLLVYEWVYHRRDFSISGVVATAALTAVDVFGKVFGPDAMVNAEAYHPVFILRRARDFQRMALNDLLFGWSTGWGGILLLYAVLAYLAWRRDRPMLRFLWWFLVLTPLPIEFLVGKSQACLYVPMVGWVLFGAVLLFDLSDALAGWLEHEPFGRPLGRTGLRAVLLAVAILLWARENLHHQRVYARPVMESLGRESWDAIQQFRAVNPRVPPRSTVIFLNDPFHSWDMLILAELWFHDRSLDIHVWRHGPPAPEEVARAAAIYTFENGKLVQVK